MIKIVALALDIVEVNAGGVLGGEKSELLVALIGYSNSEPDTQGLREWRLLWAHCGEETEPPRGEFRVGGVCGGGWEGSR